MKEQISPETSVLGNPNEIITKQTNLLMFPRGQLAGPDPPELNSSRFLKEMAQGGSLSPAGAAEVLLSHPGAGECKALHPSAVCFIMP